MQAKIQRPLTAYENMLLKTHYGEKAKLEILNAYRTIAASDEDNIKSINFDYQVLPNV